MNANFLKGIISLLVILSTNALAHYGSRGPYGGSISTSLVVDTNVFLASPTGGVFKSLNSRLTGWRPYPLGLTSGKVTSLASVNSVVFAGTSDSGVYYLNTKVADWTWVKASNGLNIHVHALVGVGTILLAGTKGGGVFKSPDNGLTWIAVNTGLQHLDIKAFVAIGSQLFLASDGGVYVSNNGGNSWQEFNDVNTKGKDAWSLTVSGNQLLAATGAGVMMSNVSSPAWTLANSGLGAGKVHSLISNPDFWFAATDNGVFASPVAAINWQSANAGLKTDTVMSLALFNGKAIAGTKAKGIFVATFPIALWTELNTGFNNLKTSALATLGEQVLVGATEKGVMVSRNLATSYVSANRGLTDSLHVSDVKWIGTTLYAATKNKGVFVSTDTGRTWQEWNVGLPTVGVRKLFVGATKLYAASYDGTLYASIPPATTWSQAQSALPINLAITSLVEANDSLFVGTERNGLFCVHPSSPSFKNTFQGQTIASLLLHKGQVFVAVAGGGLWTGPISPFNFQRNRPSFDRDVQALGAFRGYLFASFEGGVYASSDAGVNWIPAGTQANLPTYATFSTIVFTEGTTARIFVTTPDNSFYSNSISELPVLPTSLFDNTIAKTNVTIRIVPNPNAGQFALMVSEKVESVQILDFAGRTVKTLPSLSEQTVYMEAAKGIYMVQVKTPSGIAIQKLIID